MVHHIAFIEMLSQLERDGAKKEWRETWAGLLVLRLYHLWQLNPDVARSNAPGWVAVRRVVEALPEPSSIKRCLARILDSLRAPNGTPPLKVTRLLSDYADGLVGSAQWALAHDVYRAAGIGTEAVRARKHQCGGTEKATPAG